MAIVEMTGFELGENKIPNDIMKMTGTNFVPLTAAAETYLKESLNAFVDSAIARYKHSGRQEFQGYIKLEDFKRVCERQRVTKELLYSVGSYFVNRGCDTVFCYENDKTVHIVFHVMKVQMTLEQTQKLRS